MWEECQHRGSPWPLLYVAVVTFMEGRHVSLVPLLFPLWQLHCPSFRSGTSMSSLGWKEKSGHKHTWDYCRQSHPSECVEALSTMSNPPPTETARVAVQVSLSLSMRAAIQHRVRGNKGKCFLLIRWLYALCPLVLCVRWGCFSVQISSVLIRVFHRLLYVSKSQPTFPQRIEILHTAR